MKSKLLRYLSVVFAVLMIAGLIFGTISFKASAASPISSGGDTEVAATGVISALDQGWKPATRLWTKAEMAAAKPYPLPVKSGEPTISIELDEPTGTPGMSPGGAPLGKKVKAVTQADLAIFEGVSPLGFSYPAPFTRYENFANYNIYPYITVGKVYFQQYGVSYVCSGASIGNYAIWTAAHCVHSGGPGGVWSTNFVFVPAYKNGSFSNGSWSAANLWTMNGWVNNSDLRRDYGGAILYTISGYKISQIVGWLGFAYNQATALHWTAMGYPQAAPFNGQTQQICASSFGHMDKNYVSAPYPRAIGCDQTGGTSGGPWIKSFSGSAGATNYLNGNMSYRYPSQPLEIYSPYFNSEAKSLWDVLVADTP
jgi:V8-like Glu-specific endopeptidase